MLCGVHVRVGPNRAGQKVALTVILRRLLTLITRVAHLWACDVANPSGGRAMHDTTTLLPSGPSEQQARLVMWSCAERGVWTTAEDTTTNPGNRPSGPDGGPALSDGLRRGAGGRASAAALPLPSGEGSQELDDAAVEARVPCGDDPSVSPRAPGRRRAIACAGGSVPAALIALPLGVEGAARCTAADDRERRGRAVAAVAVRAASTGTTERVTPWCQTPVSRSTVAKSPRGLRPRCGSPS